MNTDPNVMKTVAKEDAAACEGIDFVDELAALEKTDAPSKDEKSAGSGTRRKSRRRLANWQRGRFSFLLFPIRVINSFFNHWGFDELLVQNAYRFQRLLRMATRFDGKDVVSRSSDGEVVVSRFPSAKTLANPIWWCIWFVQFPWLWIISRPYLRMILAAPAFLFLGYCLYILNAGRYVSPVYQSAKYRELFVAAADKEDFAVARFYGDAIIQFNPRSAGDFYNRGILEELAGNPDACRDYLTFAASSLGSGRAALWLAERLGDREQLDRWPVEAQDEYEKWLNIALEHDPNSNLVLKSLADLYRVRGNLDQAYQTLLKLEKSDPMVPTLLVALEKELGFDEKAKDRATALVESNRALLQNAPELWDVRIQTAKMLVYLGQESEATQLLLDRINAKTITQAEADALRRPVADGLVLLANKLAITDMSPLGLMKRLDYLQQAVEYDPTSRSVLDAVMEACLEVSQADNDKLTVLKEAIVRGISPEAAHFISGTVALLEGDADEALIHLDIALENNPNLPGVLNNLAYAICQQENPDLERALRLSEAAVRASPGNAYALETRGQILLLLGRWKAAIADLEVALKQDELKSLVRPGLATAYEKIGQPEIAARHRDLLSKGL